MYTNPIKFYQLYEVAHQQSLEQAELKRKEEEEAQIKKEQSKSLSVENFDDLSLFLINFAEKMYPCSEYINKPANTRETLIKVANGQLTPQQALKKIIMSKPIPRNDNFVQLYK